MRFTTRSTRIIIRFFGKCAVKEEFFMEYEDLLKKHTIFTKSRVETLSDGIFAIAMTLLVTTLEITKVCPGTISCNSGCADSQ